MKIAILEDERPALEQLVAAVRQWDPDAEIVATLDSVRGAVRWFLANPEPDVVLADIRLTDGRSLDAFERAQLKCPVVFVTAYDQYAQEALQVGGIDYVFKPVDPARLARALDKVLRLEAHFAGAPKRSGRERLLVRSGGETLTIPVSDIAWFSTEHRLVYAVRWDGRRHVVDQTLTTLEEELDSSRFFRINRSYLASIDAVRSFRSGGKGRVRVVLEPQAEAVVSAELAPAFRSWLDR